MVERMVRTQVYLPRVTYERLRRRAEKHGLTLALQIREALESYLDMAKQDEKRPPFDATELFAIIDSLPRGGPPDLAENHDRYLYSDPHGEAPKTRRAPQRPASAKTTAAAVRERRSPYRAKKRIRRVRKGNRP
jgi:hypothetical protein